jgi:hypothetical protein
VEGMQEEQGNIQPLALKGKKTEFVLDPKLKKKTVKSKKKVARSLKHDLLRNYGFNLVEN